MKITRKKFIASIVAVSGFTFNTSVVIGSRKSEPDARLILQQQAGAADEKMKICIFSKHLQWMNYKEMSSAVAEMGFDGIDLTVRRNGHVLPERVESELPEAARAAKDAGVEISLVSTDIEDANSLNEKIVKTISSVGIRNYRSGGLNYQKDMDIPSNLERIRSKFKGLETINRQYQVHSDYLNHSGEGFGSSVWDLWLALKDLDPDFVGSQFDIKHATIAGAYSWPVNFDLIKRYIRTTVIRDFKWEKVNGTWVVKPVPLGEGMVDLKKYLNLIKGHNISGPIIMMFDYPLGGAESGAKKLTMSSSDVLTTMKKDLENLKRLMREIEL